MTSLRSLYDEAEEILRRALEEAHGTRAAEMMSDLGIVFKHAGRFGEAERVYRQALAIAVRHRGPGHPDVAAIYHNLGGLEHARGNYATAEPLARAGIEIRERTVAADDPDLAAGKAALAAILDGAGKHEEAETLLREV